jgi:hypothetical protein
MNPHSLSILPELIFPGAHPKQDKGACSDANCNSGPQVSDVVYDVMTPENTGCRMRCQNIIPTLNTKVKCKKSK